MASRGRKEGEGGVFLWLQRCYCSPLRYRSGHVSSHTRQDFYGSNGVNGSNGANGRCGVYGRDGRIWLIDRWLWFVWRIELQEAGN